MTFPSDTSHATSGAGQSAGEFDRPATAPIQAAFATGTYVYRAVLPFGPVPVGRPARMVPCMIPSGDGERSTVGGTARRSKRSRVVAALAVWAVVAAVVGVRLADRLGVPGGSCAVQNVTYGSPPTPIGSPANVKHVFVVAMENTPAAKVFHGPDTPYLQSLAGRAARSTQFVDLLKPNVVSEPHYLLMEAGTATFPDGHICGDGDPTPKNSTASTEHLSTQLTGAGLMWMSYQEGLDPATTGACPIVSAGLYAPKHDPFVFFQDVAGNPPSRTNTECAAHHRSISALPTDLGAGNLAQYVFVTPNLCHDMHGAKGCEKGVKRQTIGDTWLSTNLPPLLDYADKNDGVVFLVWDEGSVSDGVLPFYAFGPSVKAGAVAAGTVTHRSLLRSVETMFGLPLLPTVTDANDLSELFSGNQLPTFTR
jgi:phosphatidylinositol-3-phosphatase